MSKIYVFFFLSLLMYTDILPMQSETECRGLGVNNEATKPANVQFTTPHYNYNKKINAKNNNAFLNGASTATALTVFLLALSVDYKACVD